MASGNYRRHVDSIILDIYDVEERMRDEGRQPDLVARYNQLLREHQLSVDQMILNEEVGALIKLPPSKLRALRTVGDA